MNSLLELAVVATSLLTSVVRCAEVEKCENPLADGIGNAEVEYMHYNGSNSVGTVVEVHCRNGRHIDISPTASAQKLTIARFSCTVHGFWKLLENDVGLHAMVKRPACIRNWVDCPLFDLLPSLLHVEYKVGEGRMSQPGDWVEFHCLLPGLRATPEKLALKFCGRDGKWFPGENTLPHCRPIIKPPSEDEIGTGVVGCQLPPMGHDLPYQYDLSACSSEYGCYNSHSEAVPGVSVRFWCKDSSDVLAGESVFTCTHVRGIWRPNDRQWPICMKRHNVCLTPNSETEGYIVSGEGTSEDVSAKRLFLPGEKARFGCRKGYRMRTANTHPHVELECQPFGRWEGPRIICTKYDWNNKRLVTVTMIFCLLGLSLVVILFFFVQRQLVLKRQLRRQRPVQTSRSGPSSTRRDHYRRHVSTPMRGSPSDWYNPDQLAFVGSRDDDAILPSYEDAIAAGVAPVRLAPTVSDSAGPDERLTGLFLRHFRRLTFLRPASEHTAVSSDISSIPFESLVNTPSIADAEILPSTVHTNLHRSASDDSIIPIIVSTVDAMQADIAMVDVVSTSTDNAQVSDEMVTDGTPEMNKTSETT